MVQYSTNVPYYVKLNLNLTFVNSMTLPKTHRRTENKDIIMILLVETHLALSKAIQNHDSGFLHWPLRKKDIKLAITCNSSLCYKVDVLSLNDY
jgi:hypothetical protein